MYLGSYHHRSINYVISSQLIDTANAFTRNPEKSISGNESHGRVSICQCFLVIHAKARVLIKTKQNKQKNTTRFYLIFALGKHITCNTSDMSQVFVKQLANT